MSVIWWCTWPLEPLDFFLIAHLPCLLALYYPSCFNRDGWNTKRSINEKQWNKIRAIKCSFITWLQKAWLKATLCIGCDIQQHMILRPRVDELTKTRLCLNVCHFDLLPSQLTISRSSSVTHSNVLKSLFYFFFFLLFERSLYQNSRSESLGSIPREIKIQRKRNNNNRRHRRR